METQKLLVIASYPPKGSIHHKNVVGVASYTKNTLTALQDVKGKRPQITVLAEQFNGKRQGYREDNIAVSRIWQRNSFMTFPLLLLEIMKHYRDTKHIFIACEGAMFGNIMSLIPFPFFLLMLRLLKKKVALVCHQVVPDIRELSGHINMNQNDLRLPVLNIAIHIFYRLLFLTTNNIIVFEEYLRKQLSRFGKAEKILVIPHGVETFKNLPSKEKARAQLNIPQNQFVILYFGFLAWYKGADWLAQAWKNQSNLTLIIAGGPNPNHLDKEYYRSYIETICRTCKQKGIILTGSVAQKDIPLYFLASDLIIFPYRTCMSASGPLSMAFSFGKPFMLSQAISKTLSAADMRKIMEHLHIKKDDFVFGLNGEFKKHLRALKENSSLQKKLEKAAIMLRHQRSWKKIGKHYYDELFNH